MDAQPSEPSMAVEEQDSVEGEPTQNQPIRVIASETASENETSVSEIINYLNEQTFDLTILRELAEFTILSN